MGQSAEIGTKHWMIPEDRMTGLETINYSFCGHNKLKYSTCSKAIPLRGPCKGGGLGILDSNFKRIADFGFRFQNHRILDSNFWLVRILDSKFFIFLVFKFQTTFLRFTFQTSRDSGYKFEINGIQDSDLGFQSPIKLIWHKAVYTYLLRLKLVMTADEGLDKFVFRALKIWKNKTRCQHSTVFYLLFPRSEKNGQLQQ